MVTRVSTVLFTVICAVFLFSSHASAQETVKSDKKNSLEKGKWAVLFGVSQNFSLTSHIGGIISLKKNTSDSRAIRIGLTGSAELRDYSSTNEQVNDNFPSNWRYETGRPTGIQLILTAQRMYYSRKKERTALYLAIGPMLQYRWNRNRITNQYDNHTVIIGDQNSFYIGGGVATALGAEWFILKTLSVSGEYAVSASFVYEEYEMKQVRIDSNTPSLINTGRMTSRLFSFRNDGVRMGVSIYFD